MKNLGFGFMRLPLLDRNDETSIDDRRLCKMVDCFLEQGFTYFDTAYFLTLTPQHHIGGKYAVPIVEPAVASVFFRNMAHGL